MQLKKIITCVAVACALTAPTQAADANAVAADLLAINNNIIEQLSAQKAKGNALNSDNILEIIRAGVSSKFNFERLTQRAMGKHWKKTDDDTKQQLTSAFKNLMEKTYAKVLERYNDEKINLLEAKELLSGKGVSVLMEVSGGGKSVQIEYIMSPDDSGEHRIVDIKVEKVSLLANYRRQFSRIISQIQSGGTPRRATKTGGKIIVDNVFTPESVVFDNFVTIVAEIKSKIRQDKHLVLDMAKASDNFDSAAVCLLLELMRDARRNKHTLEIRNVSGRLKKLLKLYQLEPLVPTKSSRTSSNLTPAPASPDGNFSSDYLPSALNLKYWSLMLL